jgi:hypothetical protein
MSNLVNLQQTGLVPQAGLQSQMGSVTTSTPYTPPGVLPGSYNPLSALGKQSSTYKIHFNKEGVVPARELHLVPTGLI